MFVWSPFGQRKLHGHTEPNPEVRTGARTEPSHDLSVCAQLPQEQGCLFRCSAKRVRLDSIERACVRSPTPAPTSAPTPAPTNTPTPAPTSMYARVACVRIAHVVRSLAYTPQVCAATQHTTRTHAHAHAHNHRPRLCLRMVHICIGECGVTVPIRCLGTVDRG